MNRKLVNISKRAEARLHKNIGCDCTCSSPMFSEKTHVEKLLLHHERFPHDSDDRSTAVVVEEQCQVPEGFLERENNNRKLK